MRRSRCRLQLSRELALETKGQQYRNVIDAFRTIFKQEGLRGLQGGLVPAMLFQMAMNGVRLGSYPILERTLKRSFASSSSSSPSPSPSPSSSQSSATTAVSHVGLKALAGATAGAFGAFVGSPLFLVKSRLQSQSAFFRARETYSYAGPWDALRSIARTDGVRGLWKGADALMVRVAIGSAVQLSTYDTVKSLAVHHAGVPDGVPAHAAAALVAGFFVAIAMNPADVVSTRLFQAKAGFYAGPWDCFVRTVRAEGLRGLYKGFAAHYARIGPHTVIQFILLEQIRRLVGIATPAPALPSATTVHANTTTMTTTTMTTLASKEPGDRDELPIDEGAQ